MMIDDGLMLMGFIDFRAYLIRLLFLIPFVLLATLKDNRSLHTNGYSKG